ncbi:hypothetical protein ElyMa_000994000 [Elysia marginata]|uniref:Uncharacterized protein n=1 Tax=Elysia marginata TaxID=1093978 RepID=A0AAV4HJ58_9GAST|nr:hypothetical protein ElyMa_000994000 [Elysia marginata]
MVCEEISASSLSYRHVHALKSAVYRERCKLRPTIPKSIEDVFSAAESPAFALESFDFIIRDEPNKILIITSEDNLLQSEACKADAPAPGGEWVLAFRAQKEINVSFYDTWSYTGLYHDDPVPGDLPQACLRLVDYKSCDRHFRSKILDDWMKIEQIRVSWIKSDVEVAYIVFNGTDTDRESWFSPGRVLSSTWVPGLSDHEIQQPADFVG